MRSAKHKVAIVTGAARGIGAGIAGHLLDAGYAVVVADNDARAGRKAAAALAARGKAWFVECDVADERQVAACVASAVARGRRIDAVVNNAALARAPRIPVEKLPLATWNRTLAVNLTGALLMAKHTAPHLARTRGAIVNIASTRALQSEANTEPYSASKGGLVALTHALAISLGPKVRVNCVSPGWIHVGTGRLRRGDHVQHPAGRVGTPADIAELVAFLLSDQAGFITGQNFVADGGMTRKMIYLE